MEIEFWWTQKIIQKIKKYRQNGRLLSEDGKNIDEFPDERVIAWRDCIPYGRDKTPTIYNRFIRVL